MNSQQIAVAVLVVLVVMAPIAQADLATTIIKSCTGSDGMGSKVCKGAMQLANKMCSRPGQSKGCVDAAIGICNKNKQVCEQVSGPLCKATGSYATSCTTAVKAATSPLGGIAGSLLG